MIRNYITIAFRAIWRSKFYSLINVAGLAIGVACCLLISLYLRDEWTFDTFHQKSGSIYRVYVKEDYGADQTFFNTVTPFPLGPALKANFEEVQEVVRINNLTAQVKASGDQFQESVMVADPGFMNVFDFELIEGVRKGILDDASHVVITEEMARKYFGEKSPMNEVLSIQMRENFEDFVVIGVAKNIPANSSIQFGIMISSLNYSKLYREQTLNSGWFNVTPETYVLLDQNADAAALQNKFPALFAGILGDDFEKSKYFVGLQPLTDIHLNRDFPPGMAPVSDPRYSYILAAVATLILFLASINFVTLSVGQTLKRAREVGIRKVVGAVRAQLIVQFIGEAVLITLIALVLGTALAGVSLQLFNDLSQKRLILQPDTFTLITSASLVVVIGILAGSYPAFVLSAFKPIAILKGKLQGNTKQTMRKVLVSVQLVLAIFLVTSSLIMRDQLTFLQQKNLGFNKEQVVALQLSVSAPGGLIKQTQAAFEKATLLKQEYSKLQTVESVAAAAHDFGNGQWTEIGFTDDQKVYRVFYANLIDTDFIPSMEIELAAGRNFSIENPADARRHIIVNEAFMREYGWDNAIGKRIPGAGFADHEIIGVVKDFNYESLYQKVQPLVMSINPEIIFSGSENVMFDNSPIPKLFVRLQAGKTAEGLASLEEGWEKVAGNDSFTFRLVGEQINAQYRGDQNLRTIISIATVLAVLIGSLGLYGLSSIAVQGRVKEIGIRKVLGANAKSLLYLLSREFMILILINVLVSVPITLYFMREWLQSYEYKTRIGPEVFLLAGVIALAVGIFTVGFQTIRTIVTRPAETLKSE